MRKFLLLLAAFVSLLVVSLLDESRSAAVIDADVTGDFGDPIPGLSQTDMFRFEIGRTIFTRRFDRSEGLGPHFNATSCVSCHEDPVPGGSSQRYRDFFIVGRDVGGDFTKLYPDCTAENQAQQATELCLPSPVMPHYGPKGTRDDPVAASVEHPRIPDEEGLIVARRNAPPIFGVGLFRLVSDEEILSRDDPDDADHDGISGRVNIISTEDDAIGRFGFKCQTASIEAFNRGALMNQMGLTSDSLEFVNASRPEDRSLLEELFEMKTAYAQLAEPKDRIIDFDGEFDPEIRRDELIALISFQENLAAPRRGRITEEVIAGEEVFTRIGCASCHVPALPTSIGMIYPYTDLLIHDMGPELADGITMLDASGSEFRTQPLWGLCQHPPFLHDGRADTVAEAILLHGGEAEASKNRYSELNGEDLRALHRFLESL